MFLYSPYTWTVLVSMILSSSTETVCIKALYQSGFEYSGFIVIMYMLSGMLALPCYYLYQQCLPGGTEESENIEVEKSDDNSDDNRNSNISTMAIWRDSIIQLNVYDEEDDDDDLMFAMDDHISTLSEKSFILRQRRSSVSIASTRMRSILDVHPFQDAHPEAVPEEVSEESDDYDNEALESSSRTTRATGNTSTSTMKPSKDLVITRGSTTGITDETKEQSQKLINIMPRWALPIIPSILNLIRTFLRAQSLIYVSASFLEMFMSASGLVLGAIAARCIRKRMVSKLRWVAVGIVTLGLILITLPTVMEPSNSTETNTTEGETPEMNSSTLGVVLLISRCLVGMLQDISEELLLQESDFPSAVLLGYEGILGLAVGLPVYLLSGLENPANALDDMTSQRIVFLGILLLLMMVTGVLTIEALAVTSNMSRSLWKTFRPLVVWAIGLGLFYSGVTVNDDLLGEAWTSPGSWLKLGGYGVILCGFFVYYIGGNIVRILHAGSNGVQSNTSLDKSSS